MKRRRCLAKTTRGRRCQNFLDTCPVESHRNQRNSEADDSKTGETAASEAAHRRWTTAAPQRPLADDAHLFDTIVKHAAQHYDLDSELIARDYWLVRTLHAWNEAVGTGPIPRAYPNPELSDADNIVGRFVFGGGTSLSAAWGITERWSEDLDLTLIPAAGTTARHFRQACQQTFRATALNLAATHNITDKGIAYCFASFLRDQQAVSRIDIVSSPLDTGPTWIQREMAMSMIGRVCDDDVLDAHPELGGFEVDTLGPGTTAMNKLLAQTYTSESGNLEHVRERARDVYDLACIARDRHRFEGHIGRDSKALLHLAENVLPEGHPKRPPEGFASLRSFDPATPEHEKLAEGYDDVINGMVWGTKIPLNEAINLAISLDPGPSEPHKPPEPNPRVAYPRT